MKEVFRLFLAFSYLCAAFLCPVYGRQPKKADSFQSAKNIETRDQLLSAINAWMKINHQPEWTMDELIGRAFDQAFIIYFVYNDSPLDPPVESFLVSLIKNRPFTHEIQLRSDQRDEIMLHTARGEITRQRLGWEKVRKNQQSWSDMDSKSSDSPRRLPLPKHCALTLDILFTPKEIAREKSLGESTRSSIFLASALTENLIVPKASRKAKHGSPELAATPTQLLDGVNEWKRSFHQTQITQDQITARVADEIFNLRDVRKDFWEIDLELLLECLTENAPFIYPIGIDTGKPAQSDEPVGFKMLSVNEELPIPPRHTVGIKISSLPWDLKAEDPPPRLDWKRIIFSYIFPKERKIRKATNRSQERK